MSFLFALAFLLVLGVGMSDNCPEGLSCGKDHSCCPYEGHFACCPLPNGVCCPESRHCCPSGTTCSRDGEGCLNASDDQEYQDDGEYDEENQYCPDGAACPKVGTTCCQRATGDYACCPFENGVCCDDMEHCCEEGQKCEGGKCLDA